MRKPGHSVEPLRSEPGPPHWVALSSAGPECICVPGDLAVFLLPEVSDLLGLGFLTGSPAAHWERQWDGLLVIALLSRLQQMEEAQKC